MLVDVDDKRCADMSLHVALNVACARRSTGAHDSPGSLCVCQPEAGSWSSSSALNRLQSRRPNSGDDCKVGAIARESRVIDYGKSACAHNVSFVNLCSRFARQVRAWEAAYARAHSQIGLKWILLLSSFHLDYTQRPNKQPRPGAARARPRKQPVESRRAGEPERQRANRETRQNNAAR